jgi:hypothetical protein
MKPVSNFKGMALYCVFVIVVAVISIFCLPNTPVLAAATAVPTTMSDTTVSLGLSNPSVKPGDDFDILINITTNAPSLATQAGLKFDPKFIEITGGSEGGFYKDWASQNNASTAMMPSKPSADNEKGVLNPVAITILSSATGVGSTGTGTFLTIHAKAKPNASGETEITLENVKVTGVSTEAGQVGKLGGVKVQNVKLNFSSAGAVQQPTGESADSAATLEPTVEVLPTTPAPGSDPNSSGAPWEIMLPIGGVLVIGAVVLVTTRKRS